MTASPHAEEAEFMAASGANAVAEVDLFTGRPCDLLWRVRALPGSVVTVRGQVFQVSSSLAAPRKDLGFELRSTVPEGQITAKARHTLKVPAVESAAVFLVKWKSGASAGDILIRVFPPGILDTLAQVRVTGGEELAPVRRALEERRVPFGSGGSTDWQGVCFTTARAACLERLKTEPLAANQCLVVFGDLPGLRGTALAKPAGAGRLIILPLSFLARFDTSPVVQNLVRELIPPS